MTYKGKSIYDVLYDPLTKESFVAEFTNKGKQGCAGLTGVLRSKSRQVPVIGGIVVFREDLVTNKVIEYSREGNYYKALFWALKAENPQIAVLSRINLILRLKWPKLVQFYGAPCGTTRDAARLYFRYRYLVPNVPTCIGVLSCMNRASSKNGYLFDVGCGYGHFYNYYLHSYPPEKIICADRSLEALVTFSRFIDTTKTLLICSDVDSALPFRKNIFTDVVSFNAFQYLKDKEKFVKNMIELLDTKSGTMWFTNNWNPKITSEFFGDCKPPSDLKKIYNTEKFRLFPERHFTRPVLKQDCLINLGVDYLPDDYDHDWRCFTLAYSNISWNDNNKFIPVNRTPDLHRLSLNSAYKLFPLTNVAVRKKVMIPKWESHIKYYEFYLPGKVKIPSFRGLSPDMEKMLKEYAEKLIMVESLCLRREPILKRLLGLLGRKLRIYFNRLGFSKMLSPFIPHFVKTLIRKAYSFYFNVQI